MTGTAHVIRGDALHLPLPDASVDLICTSPPYFALRSYQDGGEHYAGQLGSEATPTEFVAALIAATREMVRVLKPSGSIWVNLGDKYAGSGGNVEKREDDKGRRTGYGGAQRGTYGMTTKSLMGIPWRYAIACIDDLGLILRAEVIWSKPNGLPESVTDRVRRSHEQWFHFVKEPRYFSAVDEIREAHAPAGLARRAYVFNVNDAQRAGNNPVLNGEGERPANPLGKLPGSVWSIPTEPLTVPDHLGIDHFAAYPTEWPRRIIAGWSPSGVCVGCGEGRRPIGETSIDESKPPARRNTFLPNVTKSGQGSNGDGSTLWGQWTKRTITGYACGCPNTDAPTTPAVILDPFGGTGTTALVAKALGRTGITVDLSSDYCRLAAWRTTDPDQLAKAARVDKPPRQIDGQEAFDLEGIA